MANIFTNATVARSDSRNNTVIHGEIRTIESAVLSNIDAGLLYANIVSNSTVTYTITFTTQSKQTVPN